MALATEKPKDTTTSFSLTAIVSARATLADGQVLAFVHPVGQRGLPVLASKADGARLLPRNEVALLAARFLDAQGKALQGLAEKRTCLTCHNPDTPLIGPTYRDVAAKYRNDPEATAKLISQMENGGTGKWGTNVMVPLKALVPAPEMKQLADWVMTYRWDALLAE